MERKTAAQKVLLSPDVLFCISNYIDRQDDIFNCLFVNTIWTLVMVRQLWKSPVWKTAGSYQKFIRTLRGRKSRFSYGVMIQRIVFKNFKNHRSYGSIPDFSTLDLKLISRKCPNIKHITIANPRHPFSVVNVSAMLCSTPNLISFTVLNCDSEWLHGALRPMREGLCPKLQHLEISDWSRNWAFDVLRDVGERCKNIVSLKLYQRVYRTDIARLIVKSFPNLQTFECRHINFAGLQGLITGAAKLKSLTSQFEDDITDEAAESLAFGFAKLESLRIRTIHEIDFPKFSCSLAKHQSCLRHLHLATVHITDATVEKLAENCNYLESIEIYMCFQLTDSAIKALAMHRNTHLKHLMIAYNARITDEGMTHIAIHCINLRNFIVMSCTKMTNVAFMNITRECKSLVEFTVRNYPRQTLASIVHTLATRNKGTLRVFKAYDTGIKTIENTSNHKLNSVALEKLAIRCPQIKSMVLKCRMQESNGSSLVKTLKKFQNLEELIICPPVRFNKSNIKQLEKHKRLKDVTIINGLTSDAELFLEECKNESKGGMYINVVNC
ncbi:16539_t:CDS:2 [Funneliformis geosporum]|uniref:15213_t:CDS:1 n=1 Tax=Funneliformis geosporum TaxID=1117311 RepID=A0A9W4WZC1_9GLOM|nr:15213_t:CDS:2 [Funneliformis geosporum]CAI2187441.1 16539_t:CDS:2 [Funneliformis geosporum]